MCVIIYKPKDIVLPREHLEAAFCSNPGGAGFMFAEDGKLRVFKGYMAFKSFWKGFKPYEAEKCVIHFRLATCGAQVALNCHPFKVREDLAFAHNGHFMEYSGFEVVMQNSPALPGRAEKTIKVSDTYVFNEKVMQPLMEKYTDLWKDPLFIPMFSDSILGNKLVFMDSTGEVVIVREKMGTWKDGVWYSNVGFTYDEWMRRYQGKNWWKTAGRRQYYANDDREMYCNCGEWHFKSMCPKEGKQNDGHKRGNIISFGPKGRRTVRVWCEYGCRQYHADGVDWCRSERKLFRLTPEQRASLNVPVKELPPAPDAVVVEKALMDIKEIMGESGKEVVVVEKEVAEDDEIAEEGKSPISVATPAVRETVVP